MDNSMNQMPYPNKDGQKESIGPMLATLLIVAILVVGAIYFWKTRTIMKDEINLQNNTTETTDPDILKVEAELNNLEKADQTNDATEADKEFTQ